MHKAHLSACMRFLNVNVAHLFLVEMLKDASLDQNQDINIYGFNEKSKEKRVTGIELIE